MTHPFRLSAGKSLSTLRLLAAMAMLFAASAFLAPDAGAQLRYGFRLAGDFAKARLKKAPDCSLKNGSGFSGGLMLEYQFEKCGFAPDIAVLYTRYNTRLDDAQEGERLSFGRNFIEIPLHLKYKFFLKGMKELVAPMVYTGPSLMVRLDHDDSSPMLTDRLQPGWDVGIGIDIVNFIQLTAGYRFGLGNAVKAFPAEGASLTTDGWNVAANLLFSF